MLAFWPRPFDIVKLLSVCPLPWWVALSYETLLAFSLEILEFLERVDLDLLWTPLEVVAI